MLTVDLIELGNPKAHHYLLGAVGPRPICFASTIDSAGNRNLAPFSFFNVFSSNPPVAIFSPSRSGRTGKQKDTRSQHICYSPTCRYWRESSTTRRSVDPSMQPCLNLDPNLQPASRSRRRARAPVRARVRPGAQFADLVVLSGGASLDLTKGYAKCRTTVGRTGNGGLTKRNET